MRWLWRVIRRSIAWPRLRKERATAAARAEWLGGYESEPLPEVRRSGPGWAGDESKNLPAGADALAKASEAIKVAGPHANCVLCGQWKSDCIVGMKYGRSYAFCQNCWLKQFASCEDMLNGPVQPRREVRPLPWGWRNLKPQD